MMDFEGLWRMAPINHFAQLLDALAHFKGLRYSAIRPQNFAVYRTGPGHAFVERQGVTYSIVDNGGELMIKVVNSSNVSRAVPIQHNIGTLAQRVSRVMDGADWLDDAPMDDEADAVLRSL